MLAPASDFFAHHPHPLSPVNVFTEKLEMPPVLSLHKGTDHTNESGPSFTKSSAFCEVLTEFFGRVGPDISTVTGGIRSHSDGGNDPSIGEATVLNFAGKLKIVKYFMHCFINSKNTVGASRYSNETQANVCRKVNPVFLEV